MIRFATDYDIKDIVKIHVSELGNSFLSSLGNNFLSIFYRSILHSNLSFIIVAEFDGKCVGFVAGTTDTNLFYNEFIKKNFIQLSFVLLPKLFSGQVIKKIYEIKRYAGNNESGLPRSELLFMAVLDKHKLKMIGTSLFNGLLLEMQKRKVKSIKVIVGDTLAKSKHFYEKNGLVFHSRGYIHKNSPSIIYTHNLK
jgi:hypothetical protein